MPWVSTSQEQSLHLDWLAYNQLAWMREQGKLDPREVFLDYLKDFDTYYSVSFGAYRVCSSVSWEDTIDKAFMLYAIVYGSGNVETEIRALWDLAAKKRTGG